jgi:hypothetical protein
MMESVGSEPIDRRQMSGVRGSDSSHVFSKSRITPSAYFSPTESMMYLRACQRQYKSQQKSLQLLHVCSAEQYGFQNSFLEIISKISTVILPGKEFLFFLLSAYLYSHSQKGCIT